MNSTFTSLRCASAAICVGAADRRQVGAAIGLRAASAARRRPRAALAATTHGHGPRQNAAASAATARDSSGTGSARSAFARGADILRAVHRHSRVVARSAARPRSLLALAIARSSRCQPRDPLERARWLQEEKQEFAASLEPLREVARGAPRGSGGQLSLRRRADRLRPALAREVVAAQGDGIAGVGRARRASRSRPRRSSSAASTRRSRSRRRVLEQQPDHIEALLLRADARVRTRRQYEEALADAERVLELDPEQRRRAGAEGGVAARARARRRGGGGARGARERAHRRELGCTARPRCAPRARPSRRRRATIEKAREALRQMPRAASRARALVVREAVGVLRRDRAPRAIRGDPAARARRRTRRVRLPREPRRAIARGGPQQRGRSAAARGDRARVAGRAPRSAGRRWRSTRSRPGDFDEARPRVRARASRSIRPAARRSCSAMRTRSSWPGATRRRCGSPRQMTVPAHRSLVRGRVALARGEPAQALEHFTEGNRLWPNNPVSRYYAAAGGGADRRLRARDRGVSLFDAHRRRARPTRICGSRGCDAAAGQIEPALADARASSRAGARARRRPSLLELELLARGERAAAARGARAAPRPIDRGARRRRAGARVRREARSRRGGRVPARAGRARPHRPGERGRARGAGRCARREREGEGRTRARRRSAEGASRAAAFHALRGDALRAAGARDRPPRARPISARWRSIPNSIGRSRASPSSKRRPAPPSRRSRSTNAPRAPIRGDRASVRAAAELLGEARAKPTQAETPAGRAAARSPLRCAGRDRAGRAAPRARRRRRRHRGARAPRSEVRRRRRRPRRCSSGSTRSAAPRRRPRAAAG